MLIGSGSHHCFQQTALVFKPLQFLFSLIVKNLLYLIGKYKHLRKTTQYFWSNSTFDVKTPRCTGYYFICFYFSSSMILCWCYTWIFLLRNNLLFYFSAIIALFTLKSSYSVPHPLDHDDISVNYDINVFRNVWPFVWPWCLLQTTSSVMTQNPTWKISKHKILKWDSDTQTESGKSKHQILFWNDLFLFSFLHDFFWKIFTNVKR